MNKTAIIVTCLVVLIVAAVGQNLFHQLGGYRERIRAAEAEKMELAASREALLAQVADLTRQQETLRAQIAEKNSAIEGLRQDVKTLEARLNDERSEIVRIQSDDESVVRFKKEFPEFSGGMRMVERTLPSEKRPDIRVHVNYIMLPVGFVDHFISLKMTAASLEEQKLKLQAMDALHVEVASLQEQVIQLGREKEAAYHRGYEEAFAKYMELSAAYVNLMKEKRLSLGTSFMNTVNGVLGGIALGAAL